MNWRNNDIAIKETFDRDGYVKFEGFLSPQEVGEVQQEVRRYVEQVAPHVPSEFVMYEIKGQSEALKQMTLMHDQDSWFREFLYGPKFKDVAELLLGEPVEPKNLQWFNKPPRLGKPTPPHQDGYYFMLEPNKAVTMWLALDVVDEANGCVRYIPGSHLQPLRPHDRTTILGFSQGVSDYSDADRAREVAIPAKPGDLLVHHAGTIHRADNNNSDRTRRAMGLIYYPQSAHEDRSRHEAYQRSLAKELIAAGKL